MQHLVFVWIAVPEGQLAMGLRGPQLHYLLVDFLGHAGICVTAGATTLPVDGWFSREGAFDASSVSFGLHEMPRSIRRRAVGEMARVTKPGGTIIVVDYSLPQNALASALAFRAIVLYERDNYADFIHSDVDALLADAGIAVQEDRPALLGLARILVCKAR